MRHLFKLLFPELGECIGLSGDFDLGLGIADHLHRQAVQLTGGFAVFEVVQQELQTGFLTGIAGGGSERLQLRQPFFCEAGADLGDDPGVTLDVAQAAVLIHLAVSELGIALFECLEAGEDHRGGSFAVTLLQALPVELLAVTRVGPGEAQIEVIVQG